jgi:GT2 family glycosyltransferase
VKRLVFPRVCDPEVTIVVVTYGAARWVQRCLETVIAVTEPCYEVIVVDNASPGGLAARLSGRIENARVIANPVNRGFGAANNQAANLAKGSLLLFLNTDVLVHPGWLSALRDRFSATPDAGAVAPRLLNLDGTLQEAGALLFSNGYTRFYGFGDEPERPEYRFPRELDYASAACLLVSRRPFFGAGGFDTTFSPAYYEDVDLCLALRENGYRILYEPRAVATHARGASSSPTLAVRLWQRNHPVFFQRWKDRLKGYPEHTLPGGNRRLEIAARDAPATARILLAVEDSNRAGELATRLSHLCPDALRTILSAGPTKPDAVAQLAATGWEVAHPSILLQREFHYDVVVFEGRGAREIFEETIDRTQAPVARVSADAVADLAAALADAGIPPSDASGFAATSSRV